MLFEKILVIDERGLQQLLAQRLQSGNVQQSVLAGQREILIHHLAGLGEIRLGILPGLFFSGQRSAEVSLSLSGTDRLPRTNERAKEQRHEARLAMLLAGIAVAESGPEKLKNLKDPFGNGPFEYHQTGNGFELQSQLKFEGQKVILKFGR